MAFLPDLGGTTNSLQTYWVSMYSLTTTVSFTNCVILWRQKSVFWTIVSINAADELIGSRRFAWEAVVP
jgi:hypothetical protein